MPMDEGKDPEELEKELKRKEAHSRAVVLEMVFRRGSSFVF